MIFVLEEKKNIFLYYSTLPIFFFAKIKIKMTSTNYVNTNILNILISFKNIIISWLRNELDIYNFSSFK
jgi:hypothetical protein